MNKTYETIEFKEELTNKTEPVEFESYLNTLTLDNQEVLIILKTKDQDMHLKLQELSYYIKRYTKELEEQIQTKLKTI